jgi:hypothetical protein
MGSATKGWVTREKNGNNWMRIECGRHQVDIKEFSLFSVESMALISSSFLTRE